MSFENLKLIEPISKALKNEGYTKPTPIQEQAIPVILNKKDLIGCAQTGTGKTAAFAIPILQMLYTEQSGVKRPKAIQALLLCPTRELAVQIGESFTAYGKYTGLRHTTVYGGVSQFSQVNALRAGVDILIATPGRLLDLMNQGHINLANIKFFVLDEADRMLDMGFIQDIRKIIAKLPAKKQTLLFSATMPEEVSKLARNLMVNPSRVDISPASPTVDAINQSVYFVEKQHKKSLLIHLLKDKSIESALVFTRTKHGADKVVREIIQAGIRAEAIHGNKSQAARQNALRNFKMKQIRVLVATDIAARGIDVESLSHVVNYELPNIPETYVHRIGRTGRAGSSGIALSFCDSDEKTYLRDINRLISRNIAVVQDHPFAAGNPALQQSSPIPQSSGHRNGNSIGYFRRVNNKNRASY